MVPWFSLIFLAGNSAPAAVLSLLQAPKHKLSRQWATHPIFWISRPAPLQQVPASCILPEFMTSEATQRAADLPDSPQLRLWNKLCGKAKVKFLLTNLEGKQQTTKSTSNVLVIVRFLWGTEAKETNQQCSAPSALSSGISISLAFLSSCDSDSCQVASWV